MRAMSASLPARIARHGTRRGPWAGAPGRLTGAALLAGSLALCGCATETAVTPAAAPPLPPDPISAFAARATPGTQSSVVLGDGRPAAVRLNRAYAAASGRECREVVVGTGTAQNMRLVCQAENGAWVQAPPLLRGGLVR
jgi:hypothetical protein